MTLDPKSVAARLGAEHLGQIPDVGGGAFGMARLAALLKDRLEPSQSGRPGRPTDIRWVKNSSSGPSPDSPPASD